MVGAGRDRSCRQRLRGAHLPRRGFVLHANFYAFLIISESGSPEL
jgi:hypothetical protein